MFNLLLNLNLEDYVKGFNVFTNDVMFVVYFSLLICLVIVLYDLINNKVMNKECECVLDVLGVSDVEKDMDKENEKLKDSGKVDVVKWASRIVDDWFCVLVVLILYILF